MKNLTDLQVALQAIVKEGNLSSCEDQAFIFAVEMLEEVLSIIELEQECRKHESKQA